MGRCLSRRQLLLGGVLATILVLSIVKQTGIIRSGTQSMLVSVQNSIHSVHELTNNERFTVPRGLTLKNFNLGQLMRGANDDEKAEKPADVLRNNNLCPDQYSFPEDISRKFADIEQISNYTYSGRKSSTGNTTHGNSTDNDKHKFNKTVVILTPVSNYENNIFHYFKLLCSLSYPHHLISVVLGEDSSSDQTFKVASVHAKQLSPYFHSVSVHHFNLQMPRNKFSGVHDEFFQKDRRSHLAKSRNTLLFKGIGFADYALWIDVDVQYAPPDLVQHLISPGKPVIAPSCMYRKGQELDVYDKNTWQETERSESYLKMFKDGYLHLEGYTDSMRRYLPQLKNQGELVKLDGVGGCILLVKADYHRQGLIFPTFVFNHHIETEGLAKMAAKMGIGVYGLPYVSVVHW